MRHLAFLVVIVLFIGCKPSQPDPPDLPDDLPEVNTTEAIVLDELDEEFQMAPPSFVQEYDERRMGKFFWKKCLPPYGDSGDKPLLPATVQ